MPVRSAARLTGAIYLLYFITAMGAAGLTGHTPWIVSSLANVFSNVIYVVVTLRFYSLFRPVNPTISLVAALFSIAGCLTQVLTVFGLLPIHVSPFMFFGPFCLLLGYLVERSRFLPPVIGVLLMLAGVGWLITLAPAIARPILPVIEGIGILAEASLMLWLLIAGVSARRYRVPGVGETSR